MGKATRWLKGLLGMKKERDCCGYSGSLASDKREKKQSEKNEESHITPSTIDHRRRFYVAKKEGVKNKQVTGVAVERSKRSNRYTLMIGSKEGWAAVSIQSIFRGYLVCDYFVFQGKSNLIAFSSAFFFSVCIDVVC